MFYWVKLNNYSDNECDEPWVWLSACLLGPRSHHTQGLFGTLGSLAQLFTTFVSVPSPSLSPFPPKSGRLAGRLASMIYKKKKIQKFSHCLLHGRKPSATWHLSLSPLSLSLSLPLSLSLLLSISLSLFFWEPGAADTATESKAPIRLKYARSTPRLPADCGGKWLAGSWACLQRTRAGERETAKANARVLYYNYLLAHCVCPLFLFPVCPLKTLFSLHFLFTFTLFHWTPGVSCVGMLNVLFSLYKEIKQYIWQSPKQESF